MTSAQYRAALKRLGLTQAEAAELLGVSPRTSHGWANGQRIPKTAAWLLEHMGCNEHYVTGFFN